MSQQDPFEFVNNPDEKIESQDKMSTDISGSLKPGKLMDQQESTTAEPPGDNCPAIEVGK